MLVNKYKQTSTDNVSGSQLGYYIIVLDVNDSTHLDSMVTRNCT